MRAWQDTFIIRPNLSVDELERCYRAASEQAGWVYLARLDGKRRKPRPRHVQAASAAQEAFNRSSVHSSARARLPSRKPASSSGALDGRRIG